jgi:hypothetical protein
MTAVQTHVSPTNATSPCVIEGRSRFQRKVQTATDCKRVLKPGSYTRKLGHRFNKGPWVGAFIYSLALEERVTCPDNCTFKTQGGCYADGMWNVDRWRVTTSLFTQLDIELRRLLLIHDLIAIRLHEVGDFPDLAYCRWWADALVGYPRMCIWGYTAHHIASEIGQFLDMLNCALPERVLIRFSGGSGNLTTAVIADATARGLQADGGIVCPAQTEMHVCCAKCGLCMSRDVARITFIDHYQRGYAPSQARRKAGMKAVSGSNARSGSVSLGQ